MLHNPKCHARHIGPWLIETGYLNSALAAINAGSMPTIDAAARGRELDSLPPYVVDTNGVAFIGIEGPMTKGDSKFGGANTVRTRMAIRAAVNDKAVKAVMLMIDSPGGSVAGTAELARDVAAADNVKPVYAHVDGMAASAALWVASQARRVFADPTAEVGSIGVVCVIEDSSAAAELAGVKVAPLALGPTVDVRSLGGVRRVRPNLSLFQHDFDHHTLVCQRKVYPSDRPGGLQSQKLLIQRGVFHVQAGNIESLDCPAASKKSQ